MVLVNPATSFDRTPWPAAGRLLTALPGDIYKLLPIALSPILANPVNMAPRGSGPGDSLPQQASDLLYVSGGWPAGACYVSRYCPYCRMRGGLVVVLAWGSACPVCAHAL